MVASRHFTPLCFPLSHLDIPLEAFAIMCPYRNTFEPTFAFLLSMLNSMWTENSRLRIVSCEAGSFPATHTNKIKSAKCSGAPHFFVFSSSPKNSAFLIPNSNHLTIPKTHHGISWTLSSLPCPAGYIPQGYHPPSLHGINHTRLSTPSRADRGASF